MSKSDGRLNAITLKKLTPGMHADGRGLYLNVQESGSRSWILRTTVRGKRKEIGLGGLATKSLADARQEAAEFRARAKKGRGHRRNSSNGETYRSDVQRGGLNLSRSNQRYI